MRAAISLIACVIASFSPSAEADTWPTKPIRLVVPVAAGGSSDIVARVLAQGLSKELGQTVYVENLPGANSVIAATTVVRSSPNGYTFLFAPPTVFTNKIFLKAPGYDSDKDLTPVALVVSSVPLAFTARASAPFSTLPEFIDLARSGKKKVFYGVDVSSIYAIMLGQIFARRIQVPLTEVKYRAFPQALQELMNGTLDVVIGTVPAVSGLVNEGKLKLIALSSKERSPGYPSVPTVAEAVPGLVVDGFLALAAPAGTPPEIIHRMNRAVESFLSTREAQERLLALGMITTGAGTVESAIEEVRQIVTSTRSYAKEFGIEPE
jgi:tripartite-type tricarboxylate transporter receptor subunit TctC